ncbi:dihydrolipoyllysine-residue succinyltransferase component of 2-oxoglutarate dehydrogenase complex 2, mitochondrial-like isoform X1 [Fagus crenata]
MGWVKCNFHAAIRDPGNVIAMVCRTNAWSELLQPGEPIWGEVRAALFALSKTVEFEFSNTILEGDAATVLNPLKENGEKPYWVISSIIEDIKFLLRRLNCWSISLISRDVNSFARLARGSHGHGCTGFHG